MNKLEGISHFCFFVDHIQLSSERYKDYVNPNPIWNPPICLQKIVDRSDKHWAKRARLCLVHPHLTAVL